MEFPQALLLKSVFIFLQGLVVYSREQSKMEAFRYNRMLNEVS